MEFELINNVFDVILTLLLFYQMNVKKLLYIYESFLI